MAIMKRSFEKTVVMLSISSSVRIYLPDGEHSGVTEGGASENVLNLGYLVGPNVHHGNVGMGQAGDVDLNNFQVYGSDDKGRPNLFSVNFRGPCFSAGRDVSDFDPGCKLIINCVRTRSLLVIRAAFTCIRPPVHVYFEVVAGPHFPTRHDDPIEVDLLDVVAVRTNGQQPRVCAAMMVRHIYLLILCRIYS